MVWWYLKWKIDFAFKFFKIFITLNANADIAPTVMTWLFKSDPFVAELLISVPSSQYNLEIQLLKSFVTTNLLTLNSKLLIYQVSINNTKWFHSTIPFILWIFFTCLSHKKIITRLCFHILPVTCDVILKGRRIIKVCSRY